MRWQRCRQAGLLWTILLPAALIGCVGDSSVPKGSEFYCLTAKPIHDSPLDTSETREQVLAHNNDYICTCEDDCQ